MSERRTIGIDRELRLEWLDAAAAQAAKGRSPAETHVHLNEHLGDVLGGKSRSGNRGKTVTVLCRIWVNVPSRCEGLRSKAVHLLGAVEPEERLALHWAMAMAVYPFFGEVVGVMGRLLDLQGDVERQAVVRRVVENWGDRPAVSRACRAVWTSVIGWGVLSDAGRRGRYKRRTPLLHISPAVAELLSAATAFGAEGTEVAPRDLRKSPALFPFEAGGTNGRSTVTLRAGMAGSAAPRV